MFYKLKPWFEIMGFLLLFLLFLLFVWLFCLDKCFSMIWMMDDCVVLNVGAGLDNMHS